jgi:uncharacterized alpha-E superfamily protein
MLDLPGSADEEWEPLVQTTGDELLFRERFGQATKENVLAFLTFDAGNPNSIFSCLGAARENARSVRETISSEMWEQINKFYITVRSAAAAGGVFENPHNFYTEVKMASHLFTGITDGTMSHGEAWHFGRLGNLLERADKTSRILDVKYFVLLPNVTDVGKSIDDIQWSAVLKSTSAFEMYRKRHGRLAPDLVADFLILDKEFPRSIRSCVVNAEESLHTIGGSPMGAFNNAAERSLGRVRSELDYAQIQEIITGGLHEFHLELRSKLFSVANDVFDTFFATRASLNSLTPITEC